MLDGVGEIGERSRLMAANIVANRGKVIVVGTSRGKALWGELPEKYIQVPEHDEMFGPLVSWLPLQIATTSGLPKDAIPINQTSRNRDIQKIIYGGMLEGYSKR
jgi:hypothetical protein